MDSGFCISLFVCATFLDQISGEAAKQHLDDGTEHDVETAMKSFERHLKAGCVSERKEIMKAKQNLEKTLLQASFPGKNLTVVHNDIITLIFRINPRDFRGLSISSDNVMSNMSLKNQTRHAMHFPTELVERAQGTSAKEMRLTCIYLKTSCLFQDGKTHSLLNDDIVGATLGNLSITNLTQPVEIRFWHNHTLAASNVTCVFWLEGTEEGSVGNWSQRGCKTNTSWEGMVLCQCNHLTYFAVLLQISPATLDEGLLVPLTYITDVGCSISAFACLLTIFLHIFSRKIQHDSTRKIHMNLLGALFLLNMSFLASKFPVPVHWLCTVAAIFLHYSLLCCLTWLAIEGFHLYILMIRVYNSYIRRYLLKLCSVGWGFPGLAVMITFLSRNSIYGLHVIKTSSAYSNSTMCWITSPIVHHLNLIYCSGIIVFNMAVLTLVVWRLRQLRANPHQHEGHFCKDMVTVLGLTCLLGATWALVFISFGVFSVPQIFLFTILNSLQGVFFCLWYCTVRSHSQENPSTRCSHSSQ
ncbi:adhesion G-protein coupled receptor G5 [Rhineura floridana]|uniref:adhesion G-protein coupled receptor G5 n=1 Tax=Rhineura floridana TaxID=261503 RepID=UPI002AC843FE|nr:adhesion G-protein coupled receptor G5 [Rhineura floridana]XP_061449928.1 adhesion G-protein coupled receptor G5 [Rhineura floridana]XP_061449929.1 adhesion G-protein coupled receptor G5 [Rhineura floridana]XP_061449930.1 adhesion G-protein coupled receptor G5 [Rhineura floridana]